MPFVTFCSWFHGIQPVFTISFKWACCTSNGVVYCPARPYHWNRTHGANLSSDGVIIDAIQPRNSHGPAQHLHLRRTELVEVRLLSQHPCFARHGTEQTQLMLLFIQAVYAVWIKIIRSKQNVLIFKIVIIIMLMLFWANNNYILHSDWRNTIYILFRQIFETLFKVSDERHVTICYNLCFGFNDKLDRKWSTIQ